MAWYIDINPSDKSGNQYISIPAWDITGDFTIEIDCEIYNTLGGDGFDGFVFSGGTSGGGFELYRDSNNQSYRPSLWYNNTKNFNADSNIWPYASGSTANPRKITIQRVGGVVTSDFAGTAGTNVNIASSSNIVISAIGARPGGSYTLGLRLYKIKFIWSGGTRTYNPSLGSGSGVTIPTEEGGNDGTFINPPAGNAQWVFYSSGGTGADLAANATSTSTATAALTTAIALAAAAVGVSSCTASLTTGIRLAGNASGVSSASAQLTTGIRLQAAAAGQSTATASLTTGGSGFQANATATSTATAALTTQIRLAASAVGQSSATASLTTQIRLAAAAVSQSTATATLAGTAAQLAAAAVSVSSVTANLSTAIRLAAAAYSQSTVTADLSAEQVLPDVIDAYKIKMTRSTGTYKIDQHVSFSFIKATPRYSITRG